MTQRRSLSYLLAVLLGIVLAVLLFTPLRFAALSWVGIPVSIRSVQRMPFVFSVPVRVSGVVGDRAPLVDALLYELQDNTGSIWVLSPDSTVQSGERRTVQGRLMFESIVIDGDEQGEVYLLSSE
ncbi:hypothetical protein [Thermoleptolyngbya sp. M55_K2018_002]|uniref:hypothetical protein n=1 Tax=Thermoleptolyngbya sp. M55_K2018_002 TaxID=2747808 RepID=UPI0019FAA194|nr:hypothetical protein [Thermoleptolyngbya sp. M55_K2018_002]HIK40873.1 hypothetical protein [Thermoleptolyngbya sp. M55_K2018_002]